MTSTYELPYRNMISYPRECGLPGSRRAAAAVADTALRRHVRVSVPRLALRAGATRRWEPPMSGARPGAPVQLGRAGSIARRPPTAAATGSFVQSPARLAVAAGVGDGSNSCRSVRAPFHLRDHPKAPSASGFPGDRTRFRAHGPHPLRASEAYSPPRPPANAHSDAPPPRAR